MLWGQDPQLLSMHLATLRRLSSAPSADQIVLPVPFFAAFLLVLGLELAQRLQGVPGQLQSRAGLGSEKQRFAQQDATWPPRPFHRPLCHPDQSKQKCQQCSACQTSNLLRLWVKIRVCRLFPIDLQQSYLGIRVHTYRILNRPQTSLHKLIVLMHITSW